jgi:hypothetical protein
MKYKFNAKYDCDKDEVSISDLEVIFLLVAICPIFLSSNVREDLNDNRYIFLMYVLASLYYQLPNFHDLKSNLLKL